MVVEVVSHLVSLDEYRSFLRHATPFLPLVAPFHFYHFFVSHRTNFSFLLSFLSFVKAIMICSFVNVPLVRLVALNPMSAILAGIWLAHLLVSVFRPFLLLLHAATSSPFPLLFNPM